MKKIFSLLLLAMLLISCQKAEVETFTLYYSSSNLAADPNSCNEVFGVERLFVEDYESDEEKLELVISELLKGPTFFEESDGGYSSFFSIDTKDYLSGVELKGKTAYVDFKDFRQLISSASSSCGSSQLLSQLDHTILQFEGIEKVIYSINGSQQDFYEWLQMAVPENSFFD
jgi:spore germination protein GerM